MSKKSYDDIMNQNISYQNKVNHDDLFEAIESKIERNQSRRNTFQQLGTLVIILIFGLTYNMKNESTEPSLMPSPDLYTQALESWDDILLLDESDEEILPSYEIIDYLVEEDGIMNYEFIDEYLTENQLKELASYLEKESL